MLLSIKNRAIVNTIIVKRVSSFRLARLMRAIVIVVENNNY